MERPERQGEPRGGCAFDSEVVRQRKAAMLPTLLTAVRWRRRRRHAARAAAAVAAAVWVWLGLHGAWRREPGTARDPQHGQVVVNTPVARCEVVHDLPDVVERFTSSSAAPAEWWIDDAELQRLLDEDARPSGLVRVAGRVAVTAAAIDPLTSLE